ncbi:YSIRK-type signal peptide-containing protein [Streptococcus suis]|uniref:Putative IgA-specific zinc metalloproteinase n=1 Tax=Streptococcus suis TaxID=1307 RepID=A0A0Z8YCU9_STRSU|nr:YSIRK-type signal peptide-containing protein [Streptococcus suis]MDW8731586.1 YSIRK-type signal peptide-containing protein [Streptococcus suis]CYY08936.1 putative IgA-specific zinc metalloproteinase [Streptococcus suis]
MKNIFGEKRQRFGFRKLSIGLVSAAVASLFLASSVAASPSASAQSINYSYVTEQELTDAEKELIIRDLPGLAQEPDLSSSYWHSIYSIDKHVSSFAKYWLCRNRTIGGGWSVSPVISC